MGTPSIVGTRSEGLQFGVVAVIDALGFKGIWRRSEPERVLATLRATRDRAKRDAQSTTAMRKPAVNVAVTSFSDTLVVVGTQVDPALFNPEAVTDVIAAVAFSVASLTTSAIKQDVPLLYRGCVAAGALRAEEEFFVGEAIDEAAEFAERAEAAVVWLTPKAGRHLDRCAPRYPDDLLLLKAPVPLKGGYPVESWIVNPFGRTDTVERSKLNGAPTIETLRQRILAAFGDEPSVDVLIKREHTFQLTLRASGHTEQVFSREDRTRDPRSPAEEPDPFGLRRACIGST